MMFSNNSQPRWATVATIDKGRKEGGLLCPFRGELGRRLIQCFLSRGLLPYQVVSTVFIHSAVWS